MRDLTITLEPIQGMLNRFYAFVNGERWIAADGDKKRSQSDKVSNDQVKIKIRVFGIGDAIYKLGVDLPGTSNDQNINLQLTGGYHETEITI